MSAILIYIARNKTKYFIQKTLIKIKLTMVLFSEKSTTRMGVVLEKKSVNLGLGDPPIIKEVEDAARKYELVEAKLEILLTAFREQYRAMNEASIRQMEVSVSGCSMRLGCKVLTRYFFDFLNQDCKTHRGIR